MVSSMSSSQTSAPSYGERLPPEIQSDIVNAIAIYYESEDSELCDESRETLRNCLSVSQTFRWSARKHLFKRIDLSGRNELHIYVKLLRLRSIIDVPDCGIISCIRFFHLDAGIKCLFMCTPTCKPHFNRPLHKAIMQNATFVLDMLTHQKAQLETFEFIGPEACSINTMDPEIFSSFRRIITSPHLGSLKLCFLDDIPRDFLCGSSIDQLAVMHSTVSVVIEPTHSHLPYPCIEFVETDSLSLVQTLCLDHRPTEEDQPSLDTIRLHILHMREGPSASRALETEFATLVEHFPFAETLDIFFRSYDADSFLSTIPKVDLTMHKSLKYLTLDYNDAGTPTIRAVDLPNVRFGRYAEHICSIIEGCPDILQFVTIVFDKMHYFGVEIPDLNPGPWNALDTVIDKAIRFADFEGIHFEMRCYLPDISEEEREIFDREATMMIRKLLPSPTRFGMLTVSMVLCRNYR